MEDKTLNSAQSLELIGRMIAETRSKFEKGGGTTFLIWGYTSVAVSALVYWLLLATGNYTLNLLWFLIPVIGAPTTYLYERKRPKNVTTQLDRFIWSVWLTVGAIAATAPLVCPNPLVIEGLVLNIGVIVTGSMIKFRPLVWAGIVGIALTYLLNFVSSPNIIIIFAAMFVIVMIVPGHILNYRGRCSKN